MEAIYPNKPHELVIFKSSSYYESSSVDVKAVDQLANPDFSREITIYEYTAGGLLPPINPKGKGKIEAFRNVIALLQNVDPQNQKHQLSPEA